MSVIILASGNLGPFKSIVKASGREDGVIDRLRADNTDYCFTVISTDYQISEDDSLAPPVPVKQKTRDELKTERQAAVDAIKVTVSSGKEFDGDETAQTRMARAIIGMQAASVATINWTLADNISVPVTIAELTEALILAGQRQAELWPLPA